MLELIYSNIFLI